MSSLFPLVVSVSGSTAEKEGNHGLTGRFQSKVSVSKERAVETRQVLSLTSENLFFKTKAASGGGPITTQTPSRAKPLQGILWPFVPRCAPWYVGRRPGLCLALEAVPTESKPCTLAIPPILFLPSRCWLLRSSGK